MIAGGGIGTYLRNVVPAVAAVRPNWHVTALVRDAAPAPESLRHASNISIRRCDAPIYSMREQWSLREAIPADADLFWAPHYNIPLALPRRVPLAVTVHDVMHLTRPEYRASIAKRAYAHRMFQAVRARASAIVFDSSFTAGQFRRHVGEPTGTTSVVHLGVADDWRGTPPGPNRASSRPYVVFVGYHKPHKNLRGLLEAFGRIVDRVPHDLVIAGRSEGLATADKTLARAAAALGDRVTFTGEVDEATLRGCVAFADLLVQPSFDEGFGLPPLEAMAIGCACLVSTAGSLPEVCADAAAYCDPSDPGSIASAMLSLLADADARRRLVARGRSHSARFRWSDCAELTARVLTDAMLVRTHGQPSPAFTART
jgi:glycosyltransferase involved in cell wall biosynthesis